MSQNKVTLPCLRKQELAGRKQRSLNPKANPDVVAEKKEIETLLANHRFEIETGKL